jgi:hypothetical protein
MRSHPLCLLHVATGTSTVSWAVASPSTTA